MSAYVVKYDHNGSVMLRSAHNQSELNWELDTYRMDDSASNLEIWEYDNGVMTQIF